MNKSKKAIISVIILFLSTLGFSQEAKWKLISEEGEGPAPRYLAAMTFDSKRNVIVLYGGINEFSDVFDDTWEWDGIQWNKVADTGPGLGYGTKMVYDDIHDQIILFGGSPTGFYSDSKAETWAWNGDLKTWTKLLDDGPQARSKHAMAYDSKRGRIVMNGGTRKYSNDSDGSSNTWIWNGTQQSWTLAFEREYPKLVGHTMIYDKANDTILLHGGIYSGLQALLWELAETKWIAKIIQRPYPSDRTSHAFVYNSDRQVGTLFGGKIEIIFTGLNIGSETVSNDLWEYNGLEWHEIAIEGIKPEERASMSFVYDSNRNIMVMFGGFTILKPGAFMKFSDNRLALGDTWELQVETTNINRWMLYD